MTPMELNKNSSKPCKNICFSTSESSFKRLQSSEYLNALLGFIALIQTWMKCKYEHLGLGCRIYITMNLSSFWLAISASVSSAFIPCFKRIANHHLTAHCLEYEKMQKIPKPTYLLFCPWQACRIQSHQCCQRDSSVPLGSCSVEGSWRLNWSCCLLCSQNQLVMSNCLWWLNHGLCYCKVVH